MIVEWTPNVIIAIVVYIFILALILWFVRGIGKK
ncbi:hypothetical protein UFOVP190_437 [uncultured Caudovirales phage]|uniref:Uncharacterized protein n=1 Tax=uncultured Caudovirales phage TaxID=2100421 RepID=A0A6J7WI86_9CAUD|nr:hypothetical protein UFOVP190_437 [uncultured Caudovirales phage]